MAKVVINIGTGANTGDGEAIRTGFEKINAMFAELYPPDDLTLELTFDDIVNVPVVVANNVAQWNAFFDLPNYGTAFKSVAVVGNVVTLTGGYRIIVKSSLFRRNTHIVNVVDSGCLYMINDFAFSNSGLVSIASPTAIWAGYCTFGDYDGAGSVLEDIDAMTALTTAGDGCFQYCAALTSIGGVTTAGDGCFQDCAALTSTGSVTTAGDYCFTGCTSLTSIGGVTTAGDGCFTGCAALTSTGSVTTAGNGCFQDCAALTSTGSVTTAGDYCFYGCTSLTSIAFTTGLIALGTTTGNDNVFENISGNAEINLTIPTAFMTNNGGNPDGDIQYLIDNNTLVNITQI